jgi:hypothetical protein
LSCRQILARSQCATTFPQRDYRTHPVVVSWKEYGSPHATDGIVVDVPAGHEPGQALTLVVVIFAAGQAGASPEPREAAR